ncbi:MAG: hypothetical protein II816_02775, partial [Elusimicrobia bacterium]|nr:hypothetical protein [Elusimicrobiota bacterium]
NTAEVANSLSSSFKLVDGNFTAGHVYTATTTWSSGAGTVADNAITTAKIVDANITPAKLTSGLYGDDDRYDIRVSSADWALLANTATVANSLSSSFKLVDDNFTEDYVYATTSTWSSGAGTVSDGSITPAKMITGGDYTTIYDIKVSSANWATNVAWSAVQDAPIIPIVDSAFDSESENAIQNKLVVSTVTKVYTDMAAELATKADSSLLSSYATTEVLQSTWTQLSTAINNKLDATDFAKVWNSSSGYFQTEYNNFTDGSYARMWNESDGGGSQFYNGDTNIKSFVGVNNGAGSALYGKDLYAQIYAINNTTKVGARLNITADGIYYLNGETGRVLTSNDEIAKKGDLANITAAKLGAGETVSSPTKVWATDGTNQGWVDLATNTGTNGQVVGSGADLAEIYASSETLVPGDVVSIDTTKDNAIVKTKVAEDTLVAGVISTEPGVLLNKNEKGYKLALVGKVPTKVCNEGGNIKRGDMLVSASIPGYAKKAGDNPKAGTVIGKALENCDTAKGSILVLVNLQ